jgi:FAD/FMN-containing dehydrogenase
MVSFKPVQHPPQAANNHVIEADADVVLQSGVKWEDLNQTLADKGIPLFFPVSL